ncbi:MAG TPA: IS630 family transposase [Terriglobales bacterium]|nr:IS630 family transposase [Terriglobales bacterium]
MEFKVRFSGVTIKALEQVLRQGFRAGEVQGIRRVQALLEVGAGRPVPLVAARLGVHETTVYGWLPVFLVDGLATLRAGRSPGRPSKLTPSQKKRLCDLIEAGPLAAGYPSGCWSTLFLQDLIQREFGQCYNHHYLAALLHNLGLSYQKARFVSDHLDPERRQCWRKHEWPAILAEARRRGALLLFGDEAGFAQWGSLAYTWARRGRQPVVPTCGKRKALKVFGLIDYFTGRFFWQHQTTRFTADAYQAFLQGVLDQTDRPILLLQDGARYHTAAAIQPFFAAHRERLTVYQLPGYSPDYNPIEHLWKNLKKRSTHLRYFPTFDDLTTSVEEGLAFYDQHPEAVKAAIGKTLEHLGDEVAQAA